MFQVKLLSGLSLAVSVPIISADSKKEKKALRTIKPSQLPVYEEPSEFFNYEYHGKKKSTLEEGISLVRKELSSVYGATVEARESLRHIFETGKAHSLTTIDLIRDENNVTAKVGAITVGGLLGLLIGGRRKGFIKKLFYTSVGATGTAVFVYPTEASKLCQDIFNNAGDYSLIAYNFVTGVKPQGEVKPEAETEATKKQFTPAAPSTHEVRPQSSQSNDVFGSLLRQSSDVMLWGFRLFDKPKKDPPPETFDSESSVASSHALGSGLTNQVKEITKDLAEVAASSVVIDVAEKTERVAKVLSKEASSVSDLSRKVESVLDITEAVSEAVSQTKGFSYSLQRDAQVLDDVAKGVEYVAEVTESVAKEASTIARAAAETAAKVKGSAVEFRKAKRDDAVERTKDVIREEIAELSSSGVATHDSLSAKSDGRKIPSDPAVSPSIDIAQKHPKSDPTPVTTQPKSKDAVANAPKSQGKRVEGDMGMSNPDDKDMYTTRS